ncbi:adenylate/guanylate cyclase domain-containing protein, partial [Armatimonas sp.]|uniref:AAA family ATPase n=1 Tax=Armatimonas sp. TaxID=1872638 RepID=UPI00286A072B
MPLMTFQETLAQTQALLAAQGRVSYRALKRQFELDDDFIEDLKFELIEVLQVATDQDGKMLVWAGAIAPAAPTAPAVAVPEAERRQLTVMFCDLVGSTELSEKLDPEDLRELLLTYQRVSAEAIASVQGFIAKYMGDGLLVYFGYPVAHEDDARRALRSSLQILQAIEAINPQIQQKYGVTVSVRIGIHTGLVIAGEMGAGETLEKLAVVGDTPNIAARLQGVAEPGMLVISAATHRLIAAFFDCESLGRHALKGIAEPIEVFHVKSESGTQSRFEAAEKSSLTPLRGRDPEIQTLLSCWHSAKTESSQAILLRGEAGVGKSRLLWELKNHVRQEGDVWLTECFCSPFSSSTALFPIIDLLERVELKLERHDTPAQRRAKIEGFLATYDLETPENAALLASLLSVPLEGAYPPVALAPDKQMQRLMEVFVAAVQRRAEQQPVLLIVEDLHWVDASTLDLIERLLRQAGDARLLILLTSRPEFHSPWDEEVPLETITLERLSENQTREIVERLTGNKPLPAEVVAQIVQKTDGVPLFVEELTRTVLEQGGLTDKGTHYEIDGTLGMLAIPTTLHDSLIARLDRLPQAVRELAQLGAVLGREFSYEQIAAITFLSEPELRTCLTHLSDADLLFQMGMPPVARYKFKHALIQDAAYQSLLKTRRQQFHAHIAQVLAEQFTEAMANQPETLAHHYSEAANPAMAVAYWDKA